MIFEKKITFGAEAIENLLKDNFSKVYKTLGGTINTERSVELGPDALRFVKIDRSNTKGRRKFFYQEHKISFGCSNKKSIILKMRYYTKGSFSKQTTSDQLMLLNNLLSSSPRLSKFIDASLRERLIQIKGAFNIERELLLEIGSHVSNLKTILNLTEEAACDINSELSSFIPPIQQLLTDQKTTIDQVKVLGEVRFMKLFFSIYPIEMSAIFTRRCHRALINHFNNLLTSNELTIEGIKSMTMGNILEIKKNWENNSSQEKHLDNKVELPAPSPTKTSILKR